MDGTIKLSCGCVYATNPVRKLRKQVNGKYCVPLTEPTPHRLKSKGPPVKVGVVETSGNVWGGLAHLRYLEWIE